MAVNRKETVQRINEAFAENNLEKVLSFCTEDLIWTMVGDTTVRGKDSIRKWMASMKPQPPQIIVHQIVAEADVVIARGDMTMAERQDGPGIPYSWCDIYRFEGDKVAELTAFVVRIDKRAGHDRTPDESRQVASTR
jgi:ketosteroid isomerase-like protein